MLCAGAAIPEPPGPAHAPNARESAAIAAVRLMKDANSLGEERDRARNVSSGPMPDGRGGVRSLTRPMRVSPTAGRRGGGA